MSSNTPSKDKDELRKEVIRITTEVANEYADRIGFERMAIVDAVPALMELIERHTERPNSPYHKMTPEVECPNCFTVTNFNIPYDAPDDGFDVRCGWCHVMFWAIPNVTRYFTTNTKTKAELTRNTKEGN